MGSFPVAEHLDFLTRMSLWLATTLTLQNLLFSRVPSKFILGFIIRTYKKVGFGRPRKGLGFRGFGVYASSQCGRGFSV